MISEIERRAALNEIRRDTEERWLHQKRVDEALMEGVRNSELFSEFSHRTGAPSTLRQRYQQLQQASGIAPHSVKTTDPFTEGFNRG